MDTSYLDFSEKFLPIMLQETNSNIGPYDDDGDAKQYDLSAHKVDSLVNLRVRSEKRQKKSARS
jgi:hypothetical protein